MHAIVFIMGEFHKIFCEDSSNGKSLASAVNKIERINNSADKWTVTEAIS